MPHARLTQQALRARAGRSSHRALGLIVTCLAVLGAAPVAAAERRHVGARTGMLEVPVDELVTAVRRKDRAEVSRLAARIGPARLTEALRRPDAPAVQAALIGMTVLPGSGRFLGAITELLTSSDATIAAAAARTLGDVLAPVTAAELDDWDVPADAVARACAALRGVVLLPANPTAQRLAGLEAMGDAAAVCPLPTDLLALLKDPTPAIRRATALIVRPQQRLATGGFSSGTRDIDPAVASASVAALCEAIAEPNAWPKGGVKEPVWDQTRQLARRMVQASSTPVDDAVEMLDCLDPTLASDRQILDSLRARKHTPLGDRAGELVERAQNRTSP
ncbi:MAG TPA: hypothetical protein VHU40_07755 [Polyangia bacterium]|nr:hypothetical protein [Polyangia bacterium]